MAWNSHIVFVETAHSRRRYRVRSSSSLSDSSSRDYDRSITTFDKNGRLLQMEYAIEAAHQRGRMVACMDCTEFSKDLGIVVITEAAPASSTSMDDWFDDKVHRIDDHAFLFTTGLSGDSHALASALRLTSRRLRLSAGEAPSLYELIRSLAMMQHELTRTSGVRPFAVSSSLVGMDFNNHHPAAKLYQTEPGGTYDRCYFSASGRHRQHTLLQLNQLYSKYTSKQHNNSLSSNNITNTNNNNNTKETFILDMAHTLYDSLLLSKIHDDDDDDASKQQQQQWETTHDTTSLHIYLIQPSLHRRGHLRMRIAPFVHPKDFPRVANILAKDEDEDEEEG